MKSIQRHLILSQIAGLALVLGVGGTVLFFFVKSALLRQFDDAMIAKASIIRSAVTLDDGRLQWSHESTPPAEFSQQGGVEFFQITLTNNSTFRRSVSLGTNNLPHAGILTETPLVWNLTLPNGEPGRAVGLRCRIAKPAKAAGFLKPVDREHEEENDDDEHAASMASIGKRVIPKAPRATSFDIDLVMAGSTSAMDQTVGILRNGLISAGLLILGGAGLVISLAMRRSMGPLTQFARQADSIHAGTLRERFSTENLPDELRPISECLNDLFARLEQSFERERRFNSNLAHELRTPIGELRALAEVALKWGPESQPDSSKDTLDIALQMESIVKRLLDLARCETGKISLHPEILSMETLIRDTFRPFQARVAARALKLDILAPPQAEWNTDRTLLQLILINLVGNAVEYTPEHGTLSVDCETHGGRFRLVVANTVTQLTRDELPMMFHRFWRKDESRTDCSHAGLGLALAEAYAGQLGLTLRAELKDGPVLEMILETPGSAAAPKVGKADADTQSAPSGAISPQSVPVTT